MTDSWGDGWGYDYTVADTSGTVQYSGTVEAASSTESLCLAAGVYTYTIPDDNPNGWASEVGYALSACGISGGGVDVQEAFLLKTDGTCTLCLCPSPHNKITPCHRC